jgi:integrase
MVLNYRPLGYEFHSCSSPVHDASCESGRLSGIDVARIVKKLALRVALDPPKYAGHSLRAAHATSAAIAGASERSIMNQTGHRSVQMVRGTSAMTGYIR